MNSCFKKFVLTLGGTILTPIFFGSCSNQKEPVKQPLIICPAYEQITRELKLVENCASFICYGFKYENFEIDDISLLTIKADGFQKYVDTTGGQLAINPINLNSSLHTFDIEIKFINVKSTDIVVKSSLRFQNNNIDVPTAENEFGVILIDGTENPEITQPIIPTVNLEWASSTFSTTIKNFSYKGINKINNIIVNAINDKSHGTFECSIININEASKTFDIYLNGYDAPTGLIDCKFEFKINDKLIKSNSVTYSFQLDKDETIPDFRIDDWWKIGNCARVYGLEGLKKRYHIQSFVGLTRTVSITNPATSSSLNHLVRVIGQGQDELFSKTTQEGDKAALTFCFENIITVNSSAPLLIQWNSKDSNAWNENIYEETGYSEIRYWLNNDFKDKYLPYEISSFIPCVCKKTTYNTAKAITVSNDHIFLPSINEFGAAINDPKSTLLLEGERYDYYKNINSNNSFKSRIKTCVDGTNPEDYWFRSPVLDSENVVYACSHGSIILDHYLFNVKNKRCIAPCFCL